MKFFLSSLVALSIASLAQSWVSPGRVITDVGNSRSTTRKKTSIPLRDIIDGNPQWYAGGSTYQTSAMSMPKTVSQSDIDRQLKNAAELFMKSQSGYFSPMTPNDNNVNMNVMNDMNGINDGYYNNGYNNGYNNEYNNGYDNGYNNPYDTSSILSDDFVFNGPVIGPLNKWDYIQSSEYFRLYEAFPDINPNCFGFTVDILDPLKVRFFVKATGSFQSPIGGFVGKTTARFVPPDGRPLIGSTEAWSITFNDLDRMQVRSISAGYVVDRFEEEVTTGGKGLMYGVLHTIGLDFLPSRPGSKTLQLTHWLTGQFTKNGGSDTLFPKAKSDPKSIPQWWSDKQRSATEYTDRGDRTYS